jgi:hypothetical protein
MRLGEMRDLGSIHRCSVEASPIRDTPSPSRLDWVTSLRISGRKLGTHAIDAAFDQGLIGFDDNLKLLLSPKLKTAGISQKIVADNLLAYAGEPLHLPVDAKLPDVEFLSIHRNQIFMG